MSAKGDMVWNFKRKINGENYRATMGPVLTLSNGKVDPVNVEDAKMWAAEHRKHFSQGVNLVQVKKEARTVPTMELLWEEFQNSSRFADKAQSSQRGDLRTWTDHIGPFFKGVKVDAIDVSSVREFLDATYKKIRSNNQSKNGRRVNDVRALLSTMFTEAISLGYVETNPVRAVRPRKIAARDKFQLTDAQREAVLREAYSYSEELGLIVEIAMTTGLRRSNILNGQWQEIQDGEWTISGEKMKGRRQHMVPLQDGLKNRLSKWQQRLGVINANGDLGQINRNSGYIFPSTASKYDKGRRDDDKQATPEWDRPPRSSVKTAWREITKKANVEGLRFHDLRHDYGTSMARAGMTPYNLQKRMAHQDPRTTQNYINIATMDAQSELVDSRARGLSEVVESNAGKPDSKIINLPTKKR